MTDNRIDMDPTLKDLARGIRSQTPKASRALLAKICRFGVSNSGLRSELITTTLEAIENGTPLSPQQLRQLTEEAELADAAYLDLLDETGRSTPKTLKLFKTARVLAGLLLARGRNVMSATLEAAYEIALGTGRPREMLKLIEAKPQTTKPRRQTPRNL